MKKTTYQVPEIRDENDNIIQEGTFGKKSAFVNSTNSGAFDYIVNDLEALHDAQTDSASTFTTAALTVTGTTSVPTANSDNNSTTIANTAFVKTALANLVGSAPTTLDTLQELSAALGNDANFSATVANEIGEKVSKSGDTITGPILYDKTPNDDTELPNKAYVDAAVSTHALISSSSTKSGHIILASSSEAIAGAEETKAITPSTLSDVFKQLLIPLKYPSAASHNALYRGKDLTSYFNSGAMSTAIANGTFDDIFPGDYIIKSVTIDGTAYNNIKWIVGDLDYFLHRGATETVEHHLILFPENNIGTAQMNSTNTTANGYQGSDMWKNVIPKYTTGIVNAFGSDHVLEHAELITNAMNANAASASGAGLMGSAYWDWAGSYGNTDGSYPYVKVKVNIFNQAMMFGNHPFASSGHEEGNCSKQLAAFRYGQNFTRAYLCWLRDVASANHFAIAGIDSGASIRSASNVGGVRPYFLLH